MFLGHRCMNLRMLNWKSASKFRVNVVNKMRTWSDFQIDSNILYHLIIVSNSVQLTSISFQTKRTRILDAANVWAVQKRHLSSRQPTDKHGIASWWKCNKSKSTKFVNLSHQNNQIHEMHEQYITTLTTVSVCTRFWLNHWHSSDLQTHLAKARFFQRWSTYPRWRYSRAKSARCLYCTCLIYPMKQDSQLDVFGTEMRGWDGKTCPAPALIITSSSPRRLFPLLRDEHRAASLYLERHIANIFRICQIW